MFVGRLYIVVCFFTRLATMMVPKSGSLNCVTDSLEAEKVQGVAVGVVSVISERE